MLLFVLSVTVLNQSIDEGGSLFMYGMVSLALLFMIMDSIMGYRSRRRDDRLHGYNEPQIDTFPPRQRLINRRINGVLRAHRFRKIRHYKRRVHRIKQKIEPLKEK